MKFGKVDNPQTIDFTLPRDAEITPFILAKSKKTNYKPPIYVGCAKWNKTDLKNFYPKGVGTKELEYYSTQFNCIELNAFFYRIFPESTVKSWYDRSTPDFKFFPKIPQSISQFKRLVNCEKELDAYFKSIAEFKEKLGICFLQMHPTFKPDKFESLTNFIEKWPKDIGLSVELRHEDWYADRSVNNELIDLLVKNNITHTITDTAGRRDLVHQQLTTRNCFVRFTGANHISDFDRVNDWFERLSSWIKSGIENIYFFVHQNMEIESPLLASKLIKRLNEELGYNLTIPKTESQTSLL
ncbi:MAG: DUF72 domain-containing protein [Flavobacteriales bacterium]|nr:DUF72 domain-containing protein [Flavobacteriales bacterium]